MYVLKSVIQKSTQSSAFSKFGINNFLTLRISKGAGTNRTMSDSEESTWRGVPISQINGAQTPWGAPEFPLIQPASNHTVLYHIPRDGLESDLPPKPQPGKDVWDQYHVRMPCSSHSLYPVTDENGEVHLKKRWKLIESALSKPIKNCKDLTDAILSYNTKFKDKWKFRALHKLFNKYLEEDESKYFFNVTLPEIIKLALDLPKLIQAPIPLLKQHKNHSISLSQQQISSLLANAFFCTFPRRNSTKKDSEFDTYPKINFSRLYESSASKYVMEKLKCICHYFRRVCTKVPSGVVSFSRRSVPPARCPRWAASAARVAALPVHADSRLLIEDAHGLVQVDFANRFLGGGVLGHGCVQEEIRFIICPELIASMVFTEEMRPNEAVMVIGVERYSEYGGYGDTFSWAGDHRDATPRDSSGRRRCAVLAIDALSYNRRVEQQYQAENVVRELNKAWVGFSFHTDAAQAGPAHPGVATGNWGCGVYRGAPELKALVQVAACAHARRPVAYCTFGDRELRDEIVGMCDAMARHDVTVGQLYRYILKYCESDRSKTIHEFLKHILEHEAAESHLDMEPMDFSNSSDVLEAVPAEKKLKVELSPDLFSEENPTQDSQPTKIAYFTGSHSIIDTTDKMADALNKMADSSSEMMDSECIEIESSNKKLSENENTSSNNRESEKHPNGSNKSNDKGKSNNTSRLFEEMEKLDESSGKLNFNTTNRSYLDVNESPNKSLSDNEQKIEIQLSSETKKKLSGKITDYFSKKRI